jgi:hypothetical protein
VCQQTHAETESDESLSRRSNKKSENESAKRDSEPGSRGVRAAAGVKAFPINDTYGSVDLHLRIDSDALSGEQAPEPRTASQSSEVIAGISDHNRRSASFLLGEFHYLLVASEIYSRYRSGLVSTVQTAIELCCVCATLEMRLDN